MSSDILQVAQNPGQALASGGLLFGMSGWGIAASFLFSGIGFVYFKYGKSMEDTQTIICGVTLMVYPYFFSNALYMLLVGAGIIALHHLWR